MRKLLYTLMQIIALQCPTDASPEPSMKSSIFFVNLEPRGVSLYISTFICIKRLLYTFFSNLLTIFVNNLVLILYNNFILGTPVR